MNSLLSLISVILIFINLSIPTTFQELSVFESDAEVSLADFVEAEEHEDEGEREEEERSETAEENETEHTYSAAAPDFSPNSSRYSIDTSLHIFISSYIPSIFVPPSI